MKVFGSGRMGADPEVHTSGSGVPVVNFRIAENYKVGDKEQTHWHNCVAFNKLAGIVGMYVRKGDLVQIIGDLRERKWKDKDGNDRVTLEIICDEVKVVNDSHRRGAGTGTATAEDTSDIQPPA